MPDGVAPEAAPHPEIWALATLLSALGIDGSLAFALGIAGGAGFVGLGFRYEREGLSNLHISGWNPFQSSVVGGAERLGVVGELRETGGARRAERLLREALADGAPAALWIDGATLGLAPAALDGMAPTVVVVQATSGGDLTVSEGRGPAQVVDPRLLAVARGRIKNHRHRLLVLHGSVDDLRAPVRSALAAVAVGAIGGPGGNAGPEGVATLADRIDGEGRGSWRSVFAGASHLRGALVNLHAYVTRERGLLRSDQAAFERMAAELLEIPALAVTADAHEALAAGWLGVADAALPADVPAFAALRGAPSALELPAEAAALPFPLTSAEAAELLADLSGSIAALAADEHAALEQLRETLRTP